MPHLEQIAQLEEQITRFQEQINANKANLQEISGRSNLPTGALASAIRGTNITIANINEKIAAIQSQIEGLELQQDIEDIMPTIQIEPTVTIQPIQQQNGINLKSIAVIGAVILLLI